MERSHTTPPNLYKLRRGEVTHQEKKHDRHRTWLHCGLVRLTHRLIKVDTVDAMCYKCWTKGKWRWIMEDGSIEYH
jgi:hypothetical protein